MNGTERDPERRERREEHPGQAQSWEKQGEDMMCWVDGAVECFSQSEETLLDSLSRDCCSSQRLGFTSFPWHYLSPVISPPVTPGDPESQAGLEAEPSSRSFRSTLGGRLSGSTSSGPLVPGCQPLPILILGMGKGPQGESRAQVLGKWILVLSWAWMWRGVWARSLL